MIYIFVVYRESDACNLVAFLNYKDAFNYIENHTEAADLYIDSVPCYGFTVRDYSE